MRILTSLLVLLFLCTFTLAADLPGNSSTTPMSYWSSRSGRQFVLIASDAVRTKTSLTGAITAYALPKK